MTKEEPVMKGGGQTGPHEEELYPNRPLVDGRPPPLNNAFRGKTLEVYEYFVQNPGDHGIREIQEVLGYSSPSVATYHVQKLLDNDILVRNEKSRYELKNDWMNMGSLEDHLRIMSFWIPRSLIYALATFLLLVTAIGLTVLKVQSYRVWAAVVIPTTAVITGALVYDAVLLSNKLSK